MGNYQNLEKEFIERTLSLISQYERDMYKYPFKEQYNYTLLINCLLGLVVMPKERVISRLPTDRLLVSLRTDMGLKESEINSDINNLRDLIKSLRHSVAHFDIEVKSNDDEFLVDRVVFRDRQVEEDYIVASFKSDELLPFLRYYGSWVLKNLQH